MPVTSYRQQKKVTTMKQMRWYRCCSNFFTDGMEAFDLGVKIIKKEPIYTPSRHRRLLLYKYSVHQVLRI